MSDRRPSPPLKAAVRGQFASLQPGLTLALALQGLLAPYTGNWVRLRLLRAAGVTVGEGTGVGGRLWIAGGARPASRLVIGAGCFVNDGCRFDVSAPVTIGDGVHLGHDVAVLTASHELGPSDRRAGAGTAAPVTIGRGAWIGARATVLGGVTVGDGAVVAAGAVVVSSVPPDTLVGGVPAAVLRDLEG
jgi:maltose O-acetyltransferase